MVVHTSLLITATALLASATSAFSSGPLVVLESIEQPPPNFVSRGPTSSDATINLRFALTQRDPSGLEDVLRSISTPGSERYGKWLSRDEVASYIQPTAETYSIVAEWLASHSLTAMNLSYAGDWVGTVVPVQSANDIFDAVFHDFEQGHITLVHPTVNFPIDGTRAPIKKDSTSPKDITLPTSCQNTTTPHCLQELYGIPNSTVENPDKLSLFVPEYIGQSMDYSDLQSFLSLYRPDVDPTTTFSIVSVNNGTNSQEASSAGFEACLDFEYTIGLASGVCTTLLTVGPSKPYTNISDFWSSILDSALYLAGTEAPPTVVSTSYAGNENTTTQAFARAICSAYMQAGARGTSVIFSSGDGGVAGVSEEPYCDNKRFVPVFPATCPYVTSVGATQLGLGNATQVAVNMTEQFWASSGGFSAYFDRAWYQETAVAPYVDGLGDLYDGLYNKTGRGFPDISALGVDFSVYCEGFDDPGLSSGTSAATPVIASIISLLNDIRISAGKPVLGFLNPLIYASAEAFTDILDGSNPGCNTTGFYATKGWDPATGLGTPNFGKLKDIILQL